MKNLLTSLGLAAILAGCCTARVSQVRDGELKSFLNRLGLSGDKELFDRTRRDFAKLEELKEGNAGQSGRTNALT